MGPWRRLGPRLGQWGDRGPVSLGHASQCHHLPQIRMHGGGGHGGEGPLPVIRMSGLLTHALSLVPVGPCSPGFQSQQRDALKKTMVTLSWKGERSHLAHLGLLCQWIKGPRRGPR